MLIVQPQKLRIQIKRKLFLGNVIKRIKQNIVVVTN